ncbi:MAG: hypothetical protein V1770_04235 [bacterium]
MKTIQYNIIMLALFILVIVASLSVFLSNRTKNSPITQCLPATETKIQDHVNNNSDSNNDNLIFDSSIKIIDYKNKKYVNNDLKFSFLFPTNFYLNEDQYGRNSFIMVSPFAPNDPMRTTEANITNSLNITITGGDNLDMLIEDYQNKSKEKSLYPDFSLENIIINGETATRIKYNDPFSGGIIFIILLNVEEHVLKVSYFSDSAYVDAYKNIINNITFLK